MTTTQYPLLDIEARCNGLLMGRQSFPVKLESAEAYSLVLQPYNKLPAHALLVARLDVIAPDVPGWWAVRWFLQLNGDYLGGGMRPGLLYAEPSDAPSDIVHFSPTWEAEPVQVAHTWPDGRDLREMVETGMWTLAPRIIGRPT